MRFVVSVEERREMLCKPKRVPSELTRLILQQHPRQLGSKSGHHSRRTDGRDRDDSDTGKRRQNQEARDLYLYKSKGQHILTNPRVLDKIVRTSSIKTTDTVLEIGPGTGNLTLRLLDAAKEVVAVEIDTRMVEILNKRVAEHGFQDKLNVICKDALRTEFPNVDLVVANIPYGISSPLVIKLVYGMNPFRSATLLLQKEFARRLLAKPGDSEFNRLAVNVKLVAEVEFVMDVSKRDFLPCPKVDSSVVIIRPKADIPDVNLQEWWAFTRTCFNKKNRTLGATLKQKWKVLELLRLSKMTGFRTETADKCCEAFEFSSDSDDTEEGESDERLCSSSPSQMEVSLFKEKVIEILNSGGFDKKRPSKLSNEELLQLLSSFNQAGIYFHDLAKSKDAKNVALAATFSS